MTALDPAARRALTSLLAFWAEAGVDAAYADAPVDRLAPALPRPPPPRALAPPPAPARAPRAAAPARDLGEGVAAARDAAAAAATLPDLAEAAAAFARARGATTGADLVLHAPAAPAVVAWVVDAPDADDLAAGRLLAGPRGRLLERMLAAAGLQGRTLLLSAAPTPAPPGGGPNVADAARHLPFVERALALAAPIAAVLAGAGPVRAVLGSEVPILRLHGRLQDWTGPHFGAALPVMPSFSLETLLAQPPAKARAWRDILTLLARVDSQVSPP